MTSFQPPAHEPGTATGGRFGTGEPFEPAGTGQRIGGYLLDAVIVVVGWVVVAIIFAAAFGRTDIAVLIAFLAALPVSAWVYGFVCGFGRTVGQAAAGIRTVRTRTGGRVGPWNGAWRATFAAVLFPIVALVFVFALFSGSVASVSGNPQRKYVVIRTRTN